MRRLYTGDMSIIGIDCRFAATPTGLGRYTRELTTALVKKNDMRFVLFVRSKTESWIPRTAHLSVIEAPFPHYSLAEQLRFPSLIKQSRIDLLFVPHFNVPWFCPVPSVITVHDLILHRFPNDAGFIKQFAYRLLMKRAISKATSIISVSNFTKSELLQTYGNSLAKKIVVVHEAVSPAFAAPSDDVKTSTLKRRHLSKPYFLYVGNSKQHKNVQMLIAAFASLHDPTRELVLVTGGKESKSLQETEGVRLLRDVPDADLPSLYAGALYFVSASLYEGFGLPVIEAHACGCPAIVSNRASFPEIAPPGTVLVEPTVESFAQAMRTPPPHTEIGTRRSWDDVARETASVLVGNAE